MVFQNYALYPHMTVEKNLSFALRMRKVPRDEIRRRVTEAARTLGIEDLLDRKPRQLSGGQRQRVAVGRAIVREPKAFLFDEPLSNLDAKLRVATRAELKALHQRLKTTTVYVTHDQEEAMTLGDRIVVMSKGVIQQVGPPLEVYRRPVNRFVAAFIGSPPMNFVSGQVSSENGTLRFVEEAARPSPFRLDLPAEVGRRLGSPSGLAAVLGLRPQSLRPSGSAAAGLDVVVRVVEPLGDTIDVHGATLAGTPIVARVPASEPVAAGQTVRLAVDPSAIHLFQTGEFGASLL
jgi:multiple sugar transport system ATP-binding protein